jgi:anti-sigma regulatory factor (Ser/Thr protein kinase)
MHTLGSILSSRTFASDRAAPRGATSWLRSLSTGLSPTRLADAELCLDELVTNIIQHGAARTLTVSVERAGADLEITVEDDGRPFDPTAAVLPPIPHTLEEATPGGRGLLLVRTIARNLRYEHRDGANRVTLAFPLM